MRYLLPALALLVWHGCNAERVGEETIPTDGAFHHEDVAHSNSNTPPYVDLEDRLVASGSHTCLHRPDGSSMCWGANRHGQLGTGDRVAVVGAVAQTAVPIARELALGAGHTCALLDDGSVRCWGRDGSGQLGDGDATLHPVCSDDLSPIRCSVEAVVVEGLSDVVTIDAINTITLAQRADGSVWGWGWLPDLIDDDPDVDFATIERSSPMRIYGLDNAASLVAGAPWRLCAIRHGGDLWCLGRLPIGHVPGSITSAVPERIEPITNVADIVLNTSVWGLRTDGTVWDMNVWVSSSWPHQYVQIPGIDDAHAITGGAKHGCALRTDSTVWCWGWNHYGQLGRGTVSVPHETHDQPQRVVGLVDVVALASGSFHTCALTASGAVWCWGLAENGLLGHDRSDRECESHSSMDLTYLCNPSPDLVMGL